MTRFAFLLLIIFSITTSSCSTRKNKVDKRNLVPEEELISILTDVYITDGLLSFSKIYNWFSSIDTLSSYYHIIEKHGYSKETMDKTMEYYFIKNPEKLINIYDHVLGNLSEMESRFNQEAVLEKEPPVNLWQGKESYYFPNPSGTDSTFFEITLIKRGVHSLKYTATIFPDDQSYNPRITVYSCHPDSIETGKRNYIKTINYIKDGLPHNYIMFFYVPKNKILHFRGWLYSFENHPEEWEKHMLINNISLTFH